MADDAELAESVDRTPAAVRQIAYRARAARRGPPSDGGGLKQDARRPTVVNGTPALVVRLGGQIDGVLAVSVEEARITNVY